MAGKKQDPVERVGMFQPPWRERRSDGSLGDEYGPTPSTYARRRKAHAMWTWRPLSHADAIAQQGMALGRWLESGGTAKATQRELEVFDLLYCQGESTRGAAKIMGVSRDTVRKYRKRLTARMQKDQANGEDRP